MPDQETQAAAAAPSPESDLSSEIAGSLASVWARYTGARPTGGEVEVADGVVRWRLPQGLADLHTGLDAPLEDGAAPRTMTGYRRATSAAVAKATRRRVSAHISKEHRDTGATTEAFILEEITKKY